MINYFRLFLRLFSISHVRSSQKLGYMLSQMMLEDEMKELPKTDQRMLSRLADRSESAWLDFVHIYEESLMRFCVSRGLSREDAADVCQEVLKALDKNLG